MKATLRQLLQTTASAFPEVGNLQLEAGPVVVGRYFGATITTAFQPLFSADDDSTPQAWEAFARSHSRHGEGLSPWRLFTDAADDHQLVTLDRLCRAIHTLNYLAHTSEGNHRPLFLNVHPRLLDAVTSDHGAFFRTVLDRLNVSPEHIVIDIPALPPGAHHRVRQVVANFQRQGFRVALAAANRLDAQLLGHWVQPDYLRLPADAWNAPETAATVQDLARRGVPVIATRVECAASLARARAGGASLLQGFWLGRPHTGRLAGTHHGQPISYTDLK